MMAVGVLAVIGHQSSGSRSPGIGISSGRVVARCVYAAEVRLDGLVYRVGTTECAYHTGLLGRLLYRIISIAPIISIGLIAAALDHGHAFALLPFVHEVGVEAAGRPEHHTRRLIGSAVEHLHADLLCDMSCRSLVLARHHRPCGAYHEAHTRPLSRVRVCGVQICVRALESAAEALPDVLSGLVRIQRHDAARQHAAVVALAVEQYAADKTADILGLQPLVFGHFGILLHGLVRDQRSTAPLGQCGEGYVFIFPFGRSAAAADGYGYHIISHGHPPLSS